MWLSWGSVIGGVPRVSGPTFSPEELCALALQEVNSLEEQGWSFWEGGTFVFISSNGIYAPI